MANPLHRRQYEIFRNLLVKAREDAGLSQTEIALRMDKPQSFVSKYERGERRLDFTEFMEIATILSIDKKKFISNYCSLVDRHKP
jgi:transcriptional regulator with XRE-family HTH domain